LLDSTMPKSNSIRVEYAEIGTTGDRRRTPNGDSRQLQHRSPNVLSPSSEQYPPEQSDYRSIQNPDSSISLEQFAALLSGTQLTASDHGKVRCPAAATALAAGESGEQIFPLLIDSLVQQLPGQCEFFA
uniref:Uncharacterized protein n=1 Tax=Echinostoma caproni TaxID=27848 RepID=A0A183B7L6_9TREM